MDQHDSHHHHHLDDTPATAETIIHALSQFHAQQSHLDQSLAAHDLHSPSHHLEQDELPHDTQLGDMSRQELEAEVLKLRGLVSPDMGHGNTSLDGSGGSKRPRLEGASRPRNQITSSSSSSRGRGKGKEKAVNSVNANTGKRIEKERKTELYKAIRHKMRETMGMDSDASPLPIWPASSQPTGSSSTSMDENYRRIPNWLAPQGDSENQQWVEDIATELLRSLHSDTNFYPRVDDADKDLAIIQDAVKVTFANYIKRYKSENDTTHADRKARYAKNRRRWARKDLKQERRSKARESIDPTSHYALVSQEALRFDYQSSEYSSPGSDCSDDGEESKEDRDTARRIRGEKRKEMWVSIRQPAQEQEHGMSSQPQTGQYGWAPGLGAKVLEVRTPSWRSEQLNAYYAHLDSLAEYHSQSRNAPKSSSKSKVNSTGVKAGHVAPSHRRFTLPPELRRKGSGPRHGEKKRKGRAGEDDEAADGRPGGGEGGDQGWMWASGEVGVWPQREADTVGSEVVGSGIEEMF